MSHTTIVAAVVAPLVAWRVYQRVKRLMVRQRSQAWRHWTAAVLFPLLIVMLGAGALTHPGVPAAMAGMAAGVTAGVALGALALRRTVYERVGGDFYYTPNAHIGILVSMLFLGRLMYRAWELYAQGAGQAQDFSGSPLTLLVFGVLAGYYTTYAAGLLRWRKSAGASN